MDIPEKHTPPNPEKIFNYMILIGFLLTMVILWVLHYFELPR